VSDAEVPAAGAEHAHPEVNYVAKFFWLVGLTAIEVVVAIKLDGGLKLALLTFLSVWKAAIVLRYFMHLKMEGIALKLCMLFPVVLMFILFTLFLTDSQYFHYNSL
jgi:caa(3)-type oxidase subunit IV